MADLNTHRALSKSSARSQYAPLSRFVEQTKLHTFYPSWVGRNDSDMKTGSELGEENEERFRYEWMLGASVMCGIAETADKLSVHKQIANRLMEPFQYVTTLVSATEWTNFFKVECASNQHEMKALAYKMLSAYVESKPEKNDNHIPFGDQMDHGLSAVEKRLIACARCARIGYDNYDGTRDTDEDLRQAERLMTPGSYHVFEHVAQAHINDTFIGNFRGWVQQRKKIVGENVVSLDLEKLLLTRPSWI